MSNYRIFDGYTMTYQDTPTEEFPCMHNTGWKDTEDMEVYETDVLSNGRLKGVVEYDEHADRFSLRCGAELRPLFGASEFFVIGNAFQHPHLV